MPWVKGLLNGQLHQMLKTRCAVEDRSVSSALRLAVCSWLSSPEAEVGDVADWKPEPLSARPFATNPPSVLVYVRSAHFSEGGHQATAGGRTVWVLPDGRTSGQKRSRLILQALGACEDTGLDPLAYLWGLLALRKAGVLVYREAR